MSIIDDHYAHLLEEWRHLRANSKDDIAAHMEQFRVQFAFNSGKIENQSITYHDTRDVFEKGKVTSYSGDVRSLFEIQNQKACAEFLRAQAQAGRKLDQPLVLETHGVLTQGTYDENRWARGERPGTYKLGDYVVGALDAGLPADQVSSAVTELLEEISVCNSSNVLTVGAYFHVVFESIHPFADGNGRTGRSLLNYLLTTNEHPPIIIYNDDKLAYFGAMQAWDQNANLEPMKRFIKAETVKTWTGKIG